MRTAGHILLMQCVFGMLLTLGFFTFSGRMAGLSAMTAALSCILPTLLLAVWVFRHRGARSAGKIIKSLYRGEALKIFATVFLFVLSIKYLHAQFFPFMVTYILSQMVFWLAPLLEG